MLLPNGSDALTLSPGINAVPALRALEQPHRGPDDAVMLRLLGVITSRLVGTGVIRVVVASRWAGAMRSTDEGSAVSSSVLNLGGVPLEQMPALAPVTLEPMVQRILTGSSAASAPATSFASSI